ncbi:MAG TPA: hypothetical protein VNZ22_22625, partial [Bacillota bacterium]|nr:hypothetical protein [Bacillota bacterium]
VASAGLVWHYKQAGLAAANSFTSWINAGLLAYALRRKLAKLDWAELRQLLPGILGAGLCATLAAYGLRYLWTTHLGHANLLLKLGEVFVPITGATLIYLALSWWLKIPFVHDLLALVTSRRGNSQEPPQPPSSKP